MFLTLIDQQRTKQIQEEGFKEGFKEGRQEANLKAARGMLALGISLEDIAKITGLPLETIKEVQNRPSSLGFAG
ncbi:MAG: hypothetical protein LBF58_12795 [Deltaproteobacteria bacterium]|jgi:predicted transposase/invertase (TIGR01784 family)|nr:hypothetical protein [Deltaproteobacteria bacterium]